MLQEHLQPSSSASLERRQQQHPSLWSLGVQTQSAREGSDSELSSLLGQDGGIVDQEARIFKLLEDLRLHRQAERRLEETEREDPSFRVANREGTRGEQEVQNREERNEQDADDLALFAEAWLLPARSSKNTDMTRSADREVHSLEDRNKLFNRRLSDLFGGHFHKPPASRSKVAEWLISPDIAALQNLMREEQDREENMQQTDHYVEEKELEERQKTEEENKKYLTTGSTDFVFEGAAGKFGLGEADAAWPNKRKIVRKPKRADTWRELLKAVEDGEAFDYNHEKILEAKEALEDKLGSDVMELWSKGDEGTEKQPHDQSAKADPYFQLCVNAESTSLHPICITPNSSNRILVWEVDQLMCQCQLRTHGCQ
ncbi:unnamed protein product [Protopolystoma xenopodis]|uniref:Uncharacterized protein n=1 Tax=Protopolystoma xenopodis TaxID=117903 RepID=A0A3S5CHG0_9PLAT|nr:unnamed protein product [Protopolystoma xenopodis]